MSGTTTPRTVHRVRQAYDTSCGVAVVAMLARQSHEAALKAIFPRSSRRETFYTNYPDLFRGLDHFGVPHGSRPVRVRSWHDVATTSVVKAKWFERGATGWHWVVLQSRADGTRVVIDPDVNRDGTLRLSPIEEARYTPVSFASVVPTPPPARRAEDRAAHCPGPRADLLTLTVADARRTRVAPQIAAMTALSLAAVRGRLARAHGRRLVRNLFRDAWPPPARPGR